MKGRKEKQEEQHNQKQLYGYLFPSLFVRFILEHLACVWYLLLCLEEALDHYQVLVSG